MKEGPDLRFAMYLSERSGLIDYASRMLGSREAAEDVVQEAFIRFMPATPNSMPSSAQPKGYLFRVVHNLAVDMLRRKKLENLWKRHDAPSWVEPQPVPTPEETILFCEGVRRAMDMIADLPNNQRIALEMHRFEGYSIEQVAAHLGVSIATVYRLLQTAVATITLRLKDDSLDQRRSRP